MITIIFIGIILYIVLHSDDNDSGDDGNSGYGPSFGPHFFYGNQ